MAQPDLGRWGKGFHGAFGANDELATAIDFIIAPVEKKDRAMGANGAINYHELMTNDMLEAHLTKLAASQHVFLTGDRYRAQNILAAKPPGSPVLPTWLGDRANARSKAAYQRGVRVGKGQGEGTSKKGKPWEGKAAGPEGS